ncbi:6-phosphogluconolactonase [uncultured Mucilaginibacter sp.]|uniref:6-phosphogluconolactonase n=1 Tax=uncultured Mucilaginibacter sp. TaxID=797541 RepID=UPI0025D8C244|nr:glucosamine-6-phosphate deaminase [uncultured Mucilaginibacter sp.]
MKIAIHKDYDKMSRAAADLVIDQVKTKPGSLICFPSGDSPAGMFKYLIDDVKAGRVDLGQCYFVGLDEWVGLGKDDDGSCTKFLYEHFFTPLQADMARVKFFDAKAKDLDAACLDMDAFIKLHGPLDMMIVGIGMNGHIGLNEPGTDFNLYCHHAPLAQVTVEVGQKYFKKQTALTEGITLGLKYLQEAKTAVLLASGAKKASIIKQALDGDISQHVPASIFQTLPSSVILLDEGAAGELGH